MKKYFVLLVLVLLVASLGCIDKDRNLITESINETYVVRDVHLGYVNGASMIVVEYYDGDEIKIVDNKLMDFVDPERSNIIIVKVSPYNESILYHYEKLSCCGRFENYPKGRYILYLDNETYFSGIKSNRPKSRSADEETFLS